MARGVVPKPEPRTLTTQDVENLKRHNVKALVATQTPLKAIADMVGCSVTTLRKKYASELKNGHDYVYARVSLGMVNDAFKGDIRAKMAWLRQFGGWQEIIRRELTGKNGEPISIRSLDSDSLVQIVKALGAQGSVGAGSSRDAPQIDLGSGEVVDLDPIPGSTDDGTEE